MAETHVEAVIDRLKGALDALEEVSDLVDSIYSGERQVVETCRIHDDHRGFIPLFVVQYVDFQNLSPEGRKVTLDCGHSLMLPQEMATGRGESLPCVYCAEECDWSAQ